jgi:hypothetical protein
MKRISRIETLADARLEGERQALLDQRWRRWRSMLVTGSLLVGLLSGQLAPLGVVEALRAFV